MFKDLNKRFLSYFNKNLGNLQRYTAFTLAEVLITLGIIGIVAALTIPTLMSAYRGNVAVTRLKKFYSNINQAIERSEIDKGDKKNWDDMGVTGASALDWYNKYLKDYLVTLNVKIDDSGQVVIIYFPDSSLLFFNRSVWNFYPNASDFKGLDSDGKWVEASGTKFFTFFYAPNVDDPQYVYHHNKGVEPYKFSWDGSRESLLNDSGFGCKSSLPANGRAYCTALIQYDGWKISSDYPLHF